MIFQKENLRNLNRLLLIFKENLTNIKNIQSHNETNKLVITSINRDNLFKCMIPLLV